MPFGFLKRRRDEAGEGAEASGPGEEAPVAGVVAQAGLQRGVPFTALTEDWRLRGRMEIAGRLSDALNRRESIPITEVVWGSPEVGATLEPAPSLRSVDPYDLILVTAGEGSLPPLTDEERSAIRIHKVAYELVLEAPPFTVTGTVFLHSGADPQRLLERASEMYIPVIDAVARMGDAVVSDGGSEVILVNRFYLRGVHQIDPDTGKPYPTA